MTLPDVAAPKHPMPSTKKEKPQFSENTWYPLMFSLEFLEGFGV
jgi:hypothetical protein